MAELRPSGPTSLPLPLLQLPLRPAVSALVAPRTSPASVLLPLDQLLLPKSGNVATGKALPQLSLNHPAPLAGKQPAQAAAWTENKQLSAFLQQEMQKLGLGDASATLVDLSKGEIASVRGSQAFYPASVIKLPVMAEAFHQVAAGRISLDQKVTVKAANKVDTWQPPEDHRPMLYAGTTVTVRQLIELMITRSDNTATNTLIDLLGRHQITGYMQELGLSGIQVHRKLSVDSDPAADGRNTMTGNETAKLLALIGEGRLVDPASSAAMLGILGGQFDNDKIPAGLPAGAKTYHKTGETSHTTHDSALIDYQGKRYVLNVFTNLAPGAAQPKITALTKRLWQQPQLHA